MSKKINVGIVGLKPGESWAGVAHVPSFQYLSDLFEIKGVANSNLESSKKAAEELGIPLAFSNSMELVNSPEIDLVTVTIIVPRHLEVVKAAINAGKHVYCEAPLGNGLKEAEELAELAKKSSVVCAVGLQARCSPEILYLRKYIADGNIGSVISSSIIGFGGNWGTTASGLDRLGYLLNKKNGATMLTIPLAHTLAGVRDVLGDIVEVSAIVETMVKKVKSLDDGSIIDMDAPDQIIINGKFQGGVPLSVHYKGGAPVGIDGFVWDIQGTDGFIRVTAPLGHGQMVPLTIYKAKDGNLNKLEVPELYFDGYIGEPLPGNVLRNYKRFADDINNGSKRVSNFDDAVSIQKLIESIEVSAENKSTVFIEPNNRAIPLPE